MKRWIAVILVLAVIFTLYVPVIAATPSFPDVTDPAVARDIAVLQMLGVVSGDNQGKFNPDNILKRSEFCKMAVIVMGDEALEPQYRNRTIFPDVRSAHWASGYINLAVSGEAKLISGFPDGTFKPDNEITCAQAVTIILRMLGYTDADAGYQWPSGYMELAVSTGLLDGVTVGENDPLPRSQAARMFCNMLGISNKAGKTYIETLGTVTKDVIVLELDVKTADGKPGAVKTTAGTYAVKSGTAPEVLLGQLGSLVLDSGMNILTFLPKTGESKIITVSSAGAAYIRGLAGVRYDIPGDTPVFTPAGTGKFVEIFVDLRPGVLVTLYFSSGGTIEALYVNTITATEALVMTAGASLETINNFAGVNDYTMYKNGSKITRQDVFEYDVLTFDSASRSVFVSDFRLTGVYENAWPNTETPSAITIMGHSFDVLPTALEAVTKYKIGDWVTVLFTDDAQIAGMVSANDLTGNAIGIVESASTSSVAVTLLNGISVSGGTQLKAHDASQYTGELVRVASFDVGQITISRIPGPGARDVLDVEAKTVDGIQIREYVRVFERVEKSAVAQIAYSDLTQKKIPGSKVLYIGKDASGKVDTLVLDDVTGDLYTYGFFKLSWVSSGVTNETTGTDILNRMVSLSNSSASLPDMLSGSFNIISDAPGGLAASLTRVVGDMKAANAVMLTEIKNVPRTSFITSSDGSVSVTIDGVTYPVADNVQCYNKAAKTWFKTLTEARAFSNTVSVYYDRPVEEGGKIRMVITG